MGLEPADDRRSDEEILAAAADLPMHCGAPFASIVVTDEVGWGIVPENPWRAGFAICSDGPIRRSRQMAERYC